MVQEYLQGFRVQRLRVRDFVGVVPWFRVQGLGLEAYALDPRWIRLMI